MRVQIVGPLPGKPGYNPDEYNQAERQLKMLDHKPMNPVPKFAKQDTASASHALKTIITGMMDCEGVLFLESGTPDNGILIPKIICDHCRIPIINIEFISKKW